jgi:phosphoribosylformylglycinamidine synthase|tara:strand:+ start:4844 stop:5089 length:246 start_codon:yes stop_codon:yes gene_type:complete
LKISVIVTLKKEVLDPQGNTVQQTLKNMGYNNISQVRQGKFFEIEIDSNDVEKAKKELVEICNNLLANTVIEDYKITDSKE